MRRVVQLALAAVLTTTVLAACAQPQGPTDTPTGTPGTSPSGSAPTSVPPVVIPPVAIPSGKETPHVERTQSSGEITVRGVVQDGVETGCHVLRVDGGGIYLLLGGDVSTVKPGGRVEVVGVPKPLLVTTCQQGTPLQVTSIKAI